jgi:8-oxo-dGTP diphosphatase
VVWRLKAGELQVLLVHRPRYDDWSWPKGKVEPGEPLVWAALRETVEETGRQVVLGAPLPGVAYGLSAGRRKEVHYWSARVADGPDGPDGADDAPALGARGPIRLARKSEIDDARWFAAARARQRLTRSTDRPQLEAVVQAHRAGALDTRAVIVLRHAAAVGRKDWREAGESTRPLAAAGRERARRAVPLLSAYGVTAIVTSPWKRCRQTVLPYAKATGLGRRGDERLTEAAAGANPKAAVAALEELLAGGPAAVLCTHRPVLGPLMRQLARDAVKGSPARRAVPRDDPWLQTGEMIVVHLTRPQAGRHGAIVAVERHRP